MTIQSVAALALTVLGATAAASQIPRPSRDGFAPSRDGFTPSLAVDSPQPSTPLVMADSRSPQLAGVLSFVFPFGTGSFYAGHVGHGVRHLLITTVASSVLLVSAVHDLTLWGAGDGRVNGWERAALLALLANWIWGTETAVNDALAYNRRHRPPAGPDSTRLLAARLRSATASSQPALSSGPAFAPR